MAVTRLITPLLRILFAVYAANNVFFQGIAQDFPYAHDSAETFKIWELLLKFSTGVFIFYCLLSAFQEFRNTFAVNARMFNIFGLTFEILLLGIVTSAMIFGFDELKLMDVLKITSWILALLILIVVDFPKVIRKAS